MRRRAPTRQWRAMVGAARRPNTSRRCERIPGRPVVSRLRRADQGRAGRGPKRCRVASRGCTRCSPVEDEAGVRGYFGEALGGAQFSGDVDSTGYESTRTSVDQERASIHAIVLAAADPATRTGQRCRGRRGKWPTRTPKHRPRPQGGCHWWRCRRRDGVVPRTVRAPRCRSFTDNARRHMAADAAALAIWWRRARRIELSRSVNWRGRCWNGPQTASGSRQDARDRSRGFAREPEGSCGCG